MSLIVVGITGMPGSGKSTASRALEREGWHRIVMGDVIREETAKRGLFPDERNTGSVMRELRRKYGESAVARIVLSKIKEAKSERIVIDGIRSVHEANLFRQNFNILVIALHASQKRRFELLSRRGREDDPKSLDDFLRRDERELEVGVGNMIALSDECISNEHLTESELQEKVLEVVSSWLKSLQ